MHADRVVREWELTTEGQDEEQGDEEQEGNGRVTVTGLKWGLGRSEMTDGASRSSTVCRALRIRTGVVTLRRRSSLMSETPSSFGSMTSTMATS